MALMGTVVMSVFALFVTGRGSAVSGRHMSEAVRIASDIATTVAARSLNDLEEQFALRDTPSAVTVVDGVQYPESVLRSTRQPAFPLAAVTRKVSEKLPGGQVDIVFTPVDPNITQVRVIVSWDEGSGRGFCSRQKITLKSAKIRG